MKDRIRSGRPQETIGSSIIDRHAERNITNLPTFHYGQVISVKDDENSNRIKVRIPFVDDTLYYNEKGQLEDTSGDDLLPWCLPVFGRFIETPEVNSVVLVALLDPDAPFNGRIWFGSIKQFTKKDIFSTLEKEVEGEKAWESVEKNTGIVKTYYPHLKGNKIKSKKSETNFKIGIRGKSNNKLLFDQNETLLIQDEGKDTEAKLLLSKLIELKGKNIDILSTQSSKTQRPVFADPLFDYLTQTQNLLTQISTLLLSPGKITIPAPGMIIAPNSIAPNIYSATIKAKSSLEKLKMEGIGKSKFLKIN